MPKLLISDASEEYVYEIFDDEVTIGRGAANSVQVADTHASKHHGVFRRIRDHWKFIDLESSNGTRINGAFLNQAWLFDGDEISRLDTLEWEKIGSSPLVSVAVSGGELRLPTGRCYPIVTPALTISATARAPSPGDRFTGRTPSARTMVENSRRAASSAVSLTQ